MVGIALKKTVSSNDVPTKRKQELENNPEPTSSAS